MPKAVEPPDDQPPPKKKDEKEMLSKAFEKTQEFVEKWKEGNDDKVVHCPKCHGAEKTEKYTKAAALFSFAAFVVSIAALALPFMRTTNSGFSPEQWEKFLTILEGGLKAGEEAVAQPVVPFPVPTKPPPARPPPTSAAVQSSVAVSSSAQQASSAATAPSSAQAVSSAATEPAGDAGIPPEEPTLGGERP
jgi:hypothetical protein